MKYVLWFTVWALVLAAFCVLTYWLGVGGSSTAIIVANKLVPGTIFDNV